MDIDIAIDVDSDTEFYKPLGRDRYSSVLGLLQAKRDGKTEIARRGDERTEVGDSSYPKSCSDIGACRLGVLKHAFVDGRPPMTYYRNADLPARRPFRVFDSRSFWASESVIT